MDINIQNFKAQKNNSISEPSEEQTRNMLRHEVESSLRQQMHPCKELESSEYQNHHASSPGRVSPVEEHHTGRGTPARGNFGQNNSNISFG